MKKTKGLVPKKRLLVAGLLFFSLFFIHQSCTKIDTPATPGKALADVEITQRFFNVPANAPLAVRRTADAMMERNAASPYAVAFAGSNGYPAWDKAFIPAQQGAPVAAFGGTNLEGADTIVVIPIVADGNIVVLSFIRAKLDGGVSLEYLRCADYNAYSFNNVPSDSINANKAALQMMLLNNKVFGYTEFKINDKRLFHPSSDYSDTAGTGKRVKLGSNGNGAGLSELCLDIIVTTTSYHCPPEGSTGHCYGQCDHCTRYCSTESVTTSTSCAGWEPSGGSGGPTGPTGPGGGPTGGGGGGGSTPPGDFPCASSQGRGIAVANPCGGGNPIPPVVPIVPEPDPVSPINDSIPNILSRACDRQMDSLYNWGMHNGFKEQSFILVKKNGVIYPKNFRPGTTDQTSVNYFLEPDEVLLAYGHTHAEDTIHFYRTSFDGQDLAQFDVHATELGYAAILEIGNARYCFVLENVGKHSAFNIARRGRHKILYQQKLDELLGQMSNVQLATELAMVQYLGSASGCGVGLYKATAPNKNNFIKLNP
jgi:hypothetical protein